MPRTRRHGTSTHSQNSTQHSDRSTGPSTSLPAPPIASQEHQDTPLHQTEAEPTESQLTRGAKRNSRTWDVQIRGEYHLYSSMECDPDGPREANIAKQPSEIPLDQWVAFVDYRARPETKAKSEQNIRNRSNQTMPHTLGSKSFARLQKEMETQLGRVVTRAELFQVSHTTSEGSFVNEEARRNHEDLVIRSQSSSENEAFSSIFGKEHPGYVRGMSLGVVPTQVYGSSSNSGSRRNDSEGERHEVEALRAEVGRLTQQAEDREQRYERLARENDERYQRLAQENEQRYQQFQQLQQQLAYLNQHLPSRNQYIAPNQENVVSPAIGRRSSHDSHSARGEENSDHSA